MLERELRPGEVSLDELERAFRETAIEVAPVPISAAPQPAAPTLPPRPTPAAKPPSQAAKKPPRPMPEDVRRPTASPTSRSASMSIRWNT